MHLTPSEPLLQSRHADLLSLHSATCIFHYLDYDTEVMLAAALGFHVLLNQLPLVRMLSSLVCVLFLFLFPVS